jgi:hypothetical protein
LTNIGAPIAEISKDNCVSPRILSAPTPVAQTQQWILQKRLRPDRGPAIRPKKNNPRASLAQAALRRAAVLRRAVRPAAVLRRALPARLLSVRFTLGRRAAFALRFFFTIFAICFLSLFH